MRKANYHIDTNENRTSDQVRDALKEISLTDSGTSIYVRTYTLPGAKTRIITYSQIETKGTVNLDIKTSRRGKVEGDLISLLDRFDAVWNLNSSPGMRKQDKRRVPSLR